MIENFQNLNRLMDEIDANTITKNETVLLRMVQELSTMISKVHIDHLRLEERTNRRIGDIYCEIKRVRNGTYA